MIMRVRALESYDVDKPSRYPGHVCTTPRNFLQPSQVETFFKNVGLIKLAKTLSAKIVSLESTKSEKSPSLHVCRCKIFLKRRMTFPFSSASCYDP